MVQGCYPGSGANSGRPIMTCRRGQKRCLCYLVRTEMTRGWASGVFGTTRFRTPFS
jgi:hypothetical protein